MRKLQPIALLLILLFSALNVAAQEQQAFEVTKIAPNVYIHTSYKLLGNVNVPSHGMLVSTKEGVVLIDTGWGNEPTKQLLAWVKTNLKQPVKLCVPTHWHDDKMGGIEALQQQGVPVIASKLTAILAAENNKGTPDATFATDTTFMVAGQQLQVYYPGGGHTSDNLVVYLPKQKILFGGCLVKDAKAKDLGNTADANMANWATAIQNVQQRFPKAKIVIPSHGSWGDNKALTHTLYLLERQQK